MADDNGVLSWVPGDIVGSASKQLPPPGPAEAFSPMRSVFVDVPGLGVVSITYELYDYARGKSRNWTWLEKRADLDRPANPTA